jgi:hypothetical protein
MSFNLRKRAFDFKYKHKQIQIFVYCLNTGNLKIIILKVCFEDTVEEENVHVS